MEPTDVNMVCLKIAAGNSNCSQKSHTDVHTWWLVIAASNSIVLKGATQMYTQWLAIAALSGCAPSRTLLVMGLVLPQMCPGCTAAVVLRQLLNRVGTTTHKGLALHAV